jgi:diamine N-acetyltransferase
MSGRNDFAFSVTAVEEFDIARIRQLASLIWRAHYAGIISLGQIEYMLAQRYSEPVIRAELDRGDVWWRQAVRGGEPAGFACCLLNEAPGVMKLDKLYVHPAWQRHGIGAALVEDVLQIARDAGCEALSLMVNKQNEVAQAAYRKYGFVTTGAVVKDIGGGYTMDDYIMSRNLS